ncbi:tetratricopeptide repeat protein [Reyranella sp.]|uniref:O-linked N-acetylglucosamine transferase, SPINDLY family protein n=1 Tax=Reyranella sp. TaxID=1929291 RepID=UPI003D0F0C8B
MAGPPNPNLAFQQAVAAYRQGRLDEAESLCRRTLRSQAAHVGALHLLGVINLRKRNPAKAIEAFDRLLKLQPNSPDVLNNRAMALFDIGQKEKALASLDSALALRPDYREALNNRAGLLDALRRFCESAETYARLWALSPDQPKVLGSLFQSRMNACDWTDYEKISAEIVDRAARGEPADQPVPFTWHSLSPSLQRRYTEEYAARKYALQPLPSVPRAGHDRIRLAYLSSDFREHPISYMFVHLFERHDRALFEVVGLSFGPDDKSSIRARVQKAFDRFIDVRKLNDLEIAKLIQREEVDILVDLVGYTAGNRAQILTFRPAPIQVNFQGFGLGGPLIDYVFSDVRTTPDRLRGETYREKVVRLPDTWVSTDTAQPIAVATPGRADEGLPEHGFVFCSFNSSFKINPPVFDVWMRLLAAVPGSVLWLRYDSEDATANLRKSAERRGVASERLVFARRTELSLHLARHRLADLFIDTYPYGAHTTASHALWAGLPVLTLRGETFVSRVSASILHAAGLPELITESLTAYEARALELARDPGQLASLRQKLARLRLTAPLFDSERYRRHVDRAYVGMFERWRRGEPPVSFDVAAVD